jgi:peptide deformylase
MALRDIVTGAKNETLRSKSREVRNINKHILTLLDDMLETLHVEDGVGLAAPQVGVRRRIALVEYDDKLYELINPRILSSSGEAIEEEGCLSVPGVRGRVKRPDHIKVAYIDRKGKKHVEELEGITARVFCHEIDHLDGVLFIDKMIKENE